MYISAKTISFTIDETGKKEMEKWNSLFVSKHRTEQKIFWGWATICRF
ncbi:hypothetical protein EV199_4103 [Pseudobacter ginsenosidimutans]|uniref:Uncharacterized protein n=1 Tax=Pseudobacter ginsenosidimutans TaxID=661488 RepID=A0A4Q7MU66_9BACT|nr:hypothetical protein EV199_4103 [Pseudobacter ginsenosidimutans]